MTHRPVPAEFQGVWRRVSVAVDGGPPGEPSHVVWVQAGAAYADVRVPTEPPGAACPAVPAMSFAGTAFWDEPYLTWVHELDSEPPGESPVAAGDSADRGEVSWHGSDLVETGTLVEDGREVPYVEVWRRLVGRDGPMLALSAVDGSARLVQVGAHAITVIDERTRGGGGGGSYRAVYRIRQHGVWSTTLSFGAGADDLPSAPDDPPRPGGPHQFSLGGLDWDVLENR